MDGKLEVLVRRVSSLTAEERAQAGRVDRIAFAGDANDGLVWGAGEWIATGSLDGEIVSVVTITERAALAGGQPVRLGGIGGVSTLPGQRKHGFARAVLESAAAFMRDSLRVDFGLLLCAPEMVDYYGRLGWQAVPGPLQFDQPSGKRTWHDVTMVLPCQKAAWPEGVIDLRGLPW